MQSVKFFNFSQNRLSGLLMLFTAFLLISQSGEIVEKKYLRFRLIAVTSEDLATKIVADFQKGVTFQKLARIYSQHPSNTFGGTIPWILSDSLHIDFRKPLQALQSNQLSAIISRQQNYFILQKIDEKTGKDYQVWKTQKTALANLLAQIQTGSENKNPELPALLQQAETLNQSVQDEKAQFTILNFRGIYQISKEETTEAIQTFKRMLKLAEQLGLQSWAAFALRNLGQIELNAGQFELARTHFDSALVIAKHTGDSDTEEFVYGNLGQIYQAQQKYPLAIKQYRLAISLSGAQKDPARQGTWLSNLGQVYLNMGNYSRAIANFDSALAIAQRLKNRSTEGLIYGQLGLVYNAKGDFQKALEFSEKALAIAQETADKRNESAWLGNLGQIYKNRGEPNQALQYYNDALKIAREIQNRADEGILKGNIGQVYQALGDYTQAVKEFETGLTIAQETGDKYNEGVWLGSIGQVYIMLGEYENAIKQFETAVKLARETGDRRGELQRLGSIGEIYFSKGDYQQAMKKYQHSLAIAKEIGDLFNEEIRLGSIGQVYYELGKYKRAIANYDSALSIAKEIGDRYNEGIWSGSIGQAYKQLEDYESAKNYFTNALDIAEETEDRESVWRQNWNLANTFAKDEQARPARIIRKYEQALAELEKITAKLVKFVHKRSYLEAHNKQGVYDDFISFLMQQKSERYRIKALEISEASRTRALKDLLQGQLSQPALSVQKRQEAELRTEMLMTEKSRSPLLAQADQSTNRTRSGDTQSLERWAMQISIPPDTLGSTKTAPVVQRAEILEEARHHVLLIYHVLNYGIAMWVVTPDGQIHSHVQPIRADSLFDLVGKARLALGVSTGFTRGAVVIGQKKRMEAVYKPVFKKLNQILIEPMAQYLPTDPEQELVIIPHDILFAFPFACLIDSQNKFLTERNTLSTAPSVGILTFTRINKHAQMNRASPRLLLMGNPAMPDPALWLPLPGAEIEVDLIAEEVNRAGGEGLQEQGARKLQALALTGEAANEAEFRKIAPVQNYLHLATHGYQVSEPLRCGIVLAKTGNTIDTDGILTTAEVFGLNLNAELVVLSACETGLGKISSDGIAGLSTSFLYAGTSSLMVSLWKVPDKPTQFLMVKFYEELAKDGNKARALRAAQMQTMAQFPHPRAWAAFTLIGQAK